MIIFPHNTSKIILPSSKFWACNISSGGRYINLTFQPEVQRVSCMVEVSMQFVPVDGGRIELWQR